MSVNVKIEICKTIMLSLVLYGCETWSLALKDKHKRRVFENRVLSRNCGPKRDEIIRGWRKLPNEELHNLCSSPNIIRMVKSELGRWAWERSAYRVLVGKL
jgi:hypothetical protein